MALPHNKHIFQYPARFQWRQTGAPCGGSSCCTDTCIQMILEYYKDATHSLSNIRRAAQAKTSFNEGACTGINHIEVINALKYYGVSHYVHASGVDANFVKSKLWRGPVIVGVYYGTYPNWHGSARANKAEVAGRTDYTFSGAHAVLAIGSRVHKIGSTSHSDIFLRDPNHHSLSRPEMPSYDRITRAQLDKTMKDLPRYTIFSKTFCIYPTRSK